jgi:MerR family mercuric resistance operon transcriptional regulator
MDCGLEMLTISRLARLGRVNLETVRYYERQGLLPKPPRTASGYRVFPADAARRLRFIKRAQESGFSLAEIRDLLSLRMRAGASRADIRARAQKKVADVNEKIRVLKAIRKTLVALGERCDGCGPLDGCPILDSFDAQIETRSRRG